MYIGSCAGTFYALDAATGEVGWSHDTRDDGPAAQFHGDPLLTDDLVVVGADARPQAHLYGFERDGGAVRWKVPFPGGVTTQVVRHGANVLAVSATGEVAAFELASGDLVWHAEGPEGVRGARSGDPALAGDRLFVPWFPGVLDAYDAATGELLWRREVEGGLNTSAVVFAGEVVVGGMAGAYHRFSPDDGRPLGRRVHGDGGGLPYGDLMPTPACLLALEAEGGAGPAMRTSGPYSLRCLEAGQGGVRWRYESEAELSTHRPLLDDGRVIVGARGDLRVLDLETGEVLERLDIRGTPRGLGASADTLYVGTLDGRLLALPR